MSGHVAGPEMRFNDAGEIEVCYIVCWLFPVVHNCLQVETSPDEWTLVDYYNKPTDADRAEFYRLNKERSTKSKKNQVGVAVLFVLLKGWMIDKKQYKDTAIKELNMEERAEDKKRTKSLDLSEKKTKSLLVCMTCSKLLINFKRSKTEAGSTTE